MPQDSCVLVFGATGGTGRHFVAQALSAGHRVRALVRTPEKLTIKSDRLEVRQGSIDDPMDLDALVTGVDCIVMMLGDSHAQRSGTVNAAFLGRLVPAMRRQGVSRLLYQAGALSRLPGKRLSPLAWLLLHTIARAYIGQHKDNAAVMTYLAAEAPDIEWIVHRAAIGSDGPSKGTLQRSDARPGVATFADCAAYNYHLLSDALAIHTTSFSRYT